MAHDLGLLRFPDKTGNPLANTESTGAAARLALWLGMYTENSACYDDVERLVRARLFPGQITETDVRNNPDVDLNEKAIGGWGGNDYPHAGKGFNPSGTAEIVHTMSAIYQTITAHDESGLFINLHFNHEDDTVGVVVERDSIARVSIVPKIHDNVLLRVPGWATAETVRITVDGAPVPLRMVGSYAYITREQISVGSEVVLYHDLPTLRTVETLPAGDTYEFAWQGDEITGVYPNAQLLPFYPTLNNP